MAPRALPIVPNWSKTLTLRSTEENFPKAVEAITKLHYVDDYLDCCDTVEEAQRLIKEVFEIQTRGGFHVCNWVSNSRVVNEALPENLKSNSVKSILENIESLWTEKVLGLTWEPESDSFCFRTNFYKTKPEILTGESCPTKREALSLVMSLFDPLGFLSNFTVKAKILLEKQQIPKDSKLYQLSPFLDEHGLLRMRSRIQSDLPFSHFDRNPVILDSKHPYTVLLIHHSHEKNGHLESTKW